MDLERTIQAIDGAPLGYRISRKQHQSIALTMLHGLASNMTRWTEFCRDTSLIGKYDLLRLDLRGRGLSPYRGLYTRDTWVNDVATVLNHEGYDETVMMGHSLGAQVAIEYAVRHPNHCKALILIDPIVPNALVGGLKWAKMTRGGIWILIRLLQLGNKIGLRRRHILNRDLYTLDQQTRQRLAQETSLSIADLYSNPFEDIHYLPLANYLQDIYEVTRPLPSLVSLHIPVLLLISKGAALLKRCPFQLWISTIPNVETVVIDADHWPLTEKPNETRHEIEAWLRSNFNSPST